MQVRAARAAVKAAWALVVSVSVAMACHRSPGFGRHNGARFPTRPRRVRSSVPHCDAALRGTEGEDAARYPSWAFPVEDARVAYRVARRVVCQVARRGDELAGARAVFVGCNTLLRLAEFRAGKPVCVAPPRPAPKRASR